MSSFPTAIDDFTNHSAGDSLTGVSHASLHSGNSDAIEAIEAKVGTGASTPTNGKVLTGTGAGTSAWADPTGGTGGSLAGWYDVTSATYGAVGNGVADDQPAIQAAIDAAGAAGGGVVYFPPGTYLQTALAVASNAHLQNPYSNVSFVGDAATLKATDAYAILWVGSTDRFWDATVYTLGGSVAYGAQSLTLNTHGQAANFAAGDYIFIKTGQTIDASATGQPDAELNQVVTANASTGVITLAWPTAKAYAQEYYISGTSGTTSTGVTANLAPFGVANVTDRTVTDQVYRGLRFDHTGTGTLSYGMMGGQSVRVTIEDCSASTNPGFQAYGNHRFSVVRDCHLHSFGTAGSQVYTLSTDSGSSDCLWSGNQITGEHVVSMHVHEGSARVKIIGNTIAAKAGTGDDNYISIRSRARDISVVGNTLVGSCPATIYVDPSCGHGLITDNLFLGTTATHDGIWVSAPGWKISGNHLPDGIEVYGNPQTGLDAETRYLSCWVSPANFNPILGLLPANVFIRACFMQVTTLFDGSGTDLISVGFDTDGLSGAGIAAATDVSSTGQKAMTAAGYSGFSVDPVTVKAYYTHGGTAAANGKALVVLEYAFVAQWP